MITVIKPSKDQLNEISTWPIWQKEVCHFEEEYKEKEMFFFIEGVATLSIGDDLSKTIHAGDLVTIEKGPLVRWNIHEPVKKNYKYF